MLAEATQRGTTFGYRVAFVAFMVVVAIVLWGLIELLTWLHERLTWWHRYGRFAARIPAPPQMQPMHGRETYDEGAWLVEPPYDQTKDDNG